MDFASVANSADRVAFNFAFDKVLAADDPVNIWRGRMLDLFGGLARRAPAYGN